MIIDKLSNAKQYYGLSKRVEKALKYLENTDLSKLEVGKYEIDGKNIYVSVAEYETKDIEQCKWEAHRKYLDIQFIIVGKEMMGYAPINEMKMKNEYSKEKDILFLEGDGNYLVANEGTFLLFAPEDAHMPGIKAFQQQFVKKAVIKILI